jgi:nucleoside-diphosphate-sugar epimerase
MKILVTGASGFIGSNMCNYLLKRNHELTAFIRKTSDLSTLKIIAPDWRKIKFITGDLREYDSLIHVVRDQDIIFHLAGTIKGATSEEFNQGNYLATKNLLTACKLHNSNIKKIVITSSMVAGGPGTCDIPQCEDIPTRPLKGDLYGISKYIMESALKLEMEHLPISIVRPPTVIGPGDKVSLDLFRVAKLGLKIFVAGNPRSFSIVHVEDLVHGIYLCSQVPSACGEIFNFACEGTIPYRDIHEVIGTGLFKRKYGKLIPLAIPTKIFYIIGLIMEKLGQILDQPSFLNRSKVIQASASGQVMENKKAKRILNWKPKFTITKAITHAGLWYIQNGWL